VMRLSRSAVIMFSPRSGIAPGSRRPEVTPGSPLMVLDSLEIGLEDAETEPPVIIRKAKPQITRALAQSHQDLPGGG
jgi:hypothetical protein